MIDLRINLIFRSRLVYTIKNVSLYTIQELCTTPSNQAFYLILFFFLRYAQDSGLVGTDCYEYDDYMPHQLIKCSDRQSCPKTFTLDYQYVGGKKI